MILLLVDIGNTRVKWARLVDGQMGKQHAAANSEWGTKEYARVVGRGWRREGGPGRGPRSNNPTDIDRIVVSSVAGSRVDRLLVAAAREANAPAPEFVVSERAAGGVTTAYLEPWRLGVDRFVGAVGAHHLAAGKAVCVVNVGTAITIDLVDKTGRHRGGAIVPGPALMVNSLLRHTSGIRRRALGGPRGVNSLFARTTRTAIGQGSQYAAAAVIDRAIEEAQRELDGVPIVLLTGGGSAAIRPLVQSPCVVTPDLVLHGLAVWARLVSLKRRRLI